MCIEILLLFLSLAILYFYLTRKPKGMPPGDWGWPVVGSLPLADIPFTKQVELHKEKYGKIFTWKMGTRNFVFLCDYRMVKTAFANPVTAHRPQVYSLDVFTEFEKYGFGNSSGHPLQNLRRFSLRHLKDEGIGKSSFEDVIMYEVECLLQDFRKYTGKPVEVPWSVNVAIINILWKILADKRYNVDDKEIQDFERLITDIFQDAQQTLVITFDLFPWCLPFFPDFLKKKFGMKETFERIKTFQNFLKSTIDEHISSLDDDNPRDYIDAFLIEMKHNKEGTPSEKTDTFSYNELLYALLDLFSAGSETSSSTIRWIILFMAKYPQIQMRVQEEIDNAVPKDKLPSLNDREKLVFTNAVINEVMRMTPIAPVGAYHRTSEDVTIEGYNIPKDTLLVSAILSCHFDNDYWTNPKEFNPQRFITAEGTLDTRKEGFLAFSTGRRVCPGETLARIELFLFISALFQQFTFTAPEGVELSTEPNIGKPVFMIPNNFEIIITERK